MFIDLQMPNIKGSEKEQLEQMRSYLYRIIPQLQIVLNSIETSVSNNSIIATQRISTSNKELGSEAINLNTLKKQDIYTQNLNVNAKLALNYPVVKAGYLEVITNTAGYVLQRYTAYDCSSIHIRYYYRNSWHNWKKIL